MELLFSVDVLFWSHGTFINPFFLFFTLPLHPKKTNVNRWNTLLSSTRSLGGLSHDLSSTGTAEEPGNWQTMLNSCRCSSSAPPHPPPSALPPRAKEWTELLGKCLYGKIQFLLITSDTVAHLFISTSSIHSSAHYSSATCTEINCYDVSLWVDEEWDTTGAAVDGGRSISGPINQRRKRLSIDTRLFN